ncbi:unnamed protein product [Moneuplotes crassus]|uniref:Uncharacterized protein n=2 Tax=Euplotes crassus TaxID=5936 RepID=A0AAD1U0P5_EUPCR|nr:unnamed protein product [Moneuplotes crassus]
MSIHTALRDLKESTRKPTSFRSIKNISTGSAFFKNLALKNQNIFEERKRPSLRNHGRTQSMSSIIKEHVKDTGFDEKVPIPAHWKKEPFIVTTRTELKDLQRAEFLPNASYNLDGDGSVNEKEFIIGKMFDKGNKGYLTQREKAEACAAINNGLETDLIKRKEISGKKGFYHHKSRHTIDFEVPNESMPDPSSCTYGSNPDENSPSPKKTFRSKTELDSYRKDENVRTLNLLKKNFDLKNSDFVPIKFKKSEFLIKNPKHQSMSEIHDKLKKDARIKAGLDAVASMHITRETEKMVPSLRYNTKPKFPSATVMKETFRDDKIKKENQANNMNNHIDPVKRIDEKEQASFRIRRFDHDNPTFAEKIERQKKENLEHYSKTFGNITIGVHGRELPKFSTNNKEWWKNQSGYNSSPKYLSSKVMHEDRNSFKKNEPIVLAETTIEPPPLDVFKRNSIPNLKPYQTLEHKIAPKITDCKRKGPDFFEPQYDRPHKTLKKWSEIERQFRDIPRSRRYMDGLKPAKEHPSDINGPLYSSFTKNNEFKETKVSQKS